MPTTPTLPPPNTPFGHNLRPYWSLDPDIHFLNHGSYGAAPRYVQAAQQRWRDTLEAEPVRFMADILPDALRHAGTKLAQFLQATPANLAFVENATQGVNAVLRSMRWNAGDRIVIANHALTMVQAARPRDGGAPATRLIFDEGHHLWDAADSMFAAALTLSLVW